MSTDVARRAGNGIQALLLRLATLLRGLLVLALVVAAATFATGLWVFHRGWGWWLLGGVACLVPVAAALAGCEAPQQASDGLLVIKVANAAGNEPAKAPKARSASTSKATFSSTRPTTASTKRVT